MDLFTKAVVKTVCHHVHHEFGDFFNNFHFHFNYVFSYEYTSVSRDFFRHAHKDMRGVHAAPAAAMTGDGNDTQ